VVLMLLIQVREGSTHWGVGRGVGVGEGVGLACDTKTHRTNTQINKPRMVAEGEQKQQGGRVIEGGGYYVALKDERGKRNRE
jgi:hypothetical protein